MDNQNNLPSTIQGDGRKFISLLKAQLKEVQKQIADAIDEVSSVYNTLADNPDTIDEQVHSITVKEQRSNGKVTLRVRWNSDNIKQYNGAVIDVKEANEYEFDNWEELKYTKTYSTAKTNEYVIENCSVGSKYYIRVRGKDIRNALSVSANAPTATYYISPMDHTPKPPYEGTVVFDERGVYWHWKQYDQNEYSWTELRLDEHVGDAYNRLDITSDLWSDKIPVNRVGKAYLYNKGVGNSYSSPLEIEYAKSVPAAPKYLKITPVFEGLQIEFDNIPEGCNGAIVYINNEPHRVIDNKYNYICSTGTYTVKVCFTDVFGEGTMSDPQTVGTIEEIPPNAIHITDKVVFDDGVIVGKYIGDRQIVGTKIQEDSITTGHIQANAINSDKIAANAVTATKIKSGEIKTNHMLANSINGDRIIANTLDAKKIKAGSITSEQIGAGAVKADDIAAGAISTDKLAAGAVTAQKMKVDSLSAISANLGTVQGGTIIGTTIRNASNSFSVDANGNIRGVNITGSRIDSSSVYAGGSQLRNVHVSQQTIRNNTKIQVPSGYSLTKTILIINWAENGFTPNSSTAPTNGTQHYVIGGRYFNDDEWNKFQSFANSQTPFEVWRPGGGEQSKVWNNMRDKRGDYSPPFMLVINNSGLDFDNGVKVGKGRKFVICQDGTFYNFYFNGVMGWTGSMGVTLISFW